MQLQRTALKLGLAALVTTVVAGAVLFKAGEAFLEHRRLRMEVQCLQQEYDAQLAELGRVLSEGERLRTDEQAQQQILIDRYGYSRPDETPILIVDEQE